MQETLAELETYIKSLKKSAKILHCQYSQVPLPLFLDVGLTPIETYQNQEPTHEHHHHEHYSHSHHLDNDGFVSISFQSDRPFDVYKFESLIFLMGK